MTTAKAKKSQRPRKPRNRGAGHGSIANNPRVMAILERTRAARAAIDESIKGIRLLEPVGMRDIAPSPPRSSYGFADPDYGSRAWNKPRELADDVDTDPAPTFDLAPTTAEMEEPYLDDMLQDPVPAEGLVAIVLPDDLYERVALRAFHTGLSMSDVLELALTRMPRLPKCPCCVDKCARPVLRARARLSCGCTAAAQVAADTSLVPSLVPLANCPPKS